MRSTNQLLALDVCFYNSAALSDRDKGQNEQTSRCCFHLSFLYPSTIFSHLNSDFFFFFAATEQNNSTKQERKDKTSSKTFCSCAAKYKNTENKKRTLNERKSRASHLKRMPEVPRTRRLSVFCLVTNSGGREKTVLASRSGKLFAITAPQDVSCEFFQAVWLSVRRRDECWG